jgi:biotin operon repressor
MSNSEKNSLEEIKQLLGDIKGILLLINQDKLQAAKATLLKSGSLEQQVYDLCDGENSNKTIADTLKKSEGNIRGSISSLRQKGLIKTIERNGQKVHEQIL